MTTKKNGYISIDNAIALLFPIGGLLYIDGDADPNILYEGSTWQLIGQDRCIMGAGGTHAVGQTVEAGLPDIDGIATRAVSDIWSGTGPFYNAGAAGVCFSGGGIRWTNLGFQASRSNPIYGNSDTVQPPAYFVNIWKRIA